MCRSVAFSIFSLFARFPFVSFLRLLTFVYWFVYWFGCLFICLGDIVCLAPLEMILEFRAGNLKIVINKDKENTATELRTKKKEDELRIRYINRNHRWNWKVQVKSTYSHSFQLHWMFFGWWQPKKTKQKQTNKQKNLVNSGRKEKKTKNNPTTPQKDRKTKHGWPIPQATTDQWGI